MIYSKNAEVLNQRYPSTYEKIKNVRLDKQYYELVQTKIQSPTLKVNDRDRSYYLHSRYNPLREAESFVRENYDETISTYIIYGMGFLYHIEALLKKARKAQIIVFESNIYVLKSAAENIDLYRVLKADRVKVVFEDDIKGFSSKFKKALEMDNKKLIIHVPSLSAMPDDLLEIKYLLEEYKMKQRSILKHIDELDYNFEDNLSNYDDNIDMLFDRFNNIPIIIVSAGPSLEKNIKFLKAAKDKAIVLATSRTVKSLLKAEVSPDIIIVTDAQPFVYNSHLKGIDIDIPIIALSTCDKRIFENYGGHKFIALQKDYIPAEKYAVKNNNVLIETGNSVAAAALDIAIRLGCSPIIFVGQDLAYTDSKTHAASVGSRNIKGDKNLRPVEDIHGNTVYTSMDLFSILRWIQNRISRERDKTFIDATEGGARIKGTKIMTLEDVIDKELQNSKSINLKFSKEVKDNE